MNILLLIVLSLSSVTGCKNTDSSGEQESALPTLQTGAERMDYYLPKLAGKRVGLVINQTSVVGKTPLPDTLLAAGIDVRKIFAPEHGFRGDAADGATILDGKDAKTGLPVISIYGKKKKPAPADLEGIDIIIFDIQDVGARFYTFISSMHYVMEACAENNIPVLIFDRPNPNGFYVDGPVLDPAYSSFVGMHPVPVVHGMTIGEYAQMINGEGWLANGVQCALEVVTCSHYRHSDTYEVPIPPSPNLPTAESIYLYPSLCFFEGTGVSVGRGTDKPFEVFGAPAATQFAYTFTPAPNKGSTQPPFNGQRCYGRDLSQLPDSVLLAGRLQLEYLIDMYQSIGATTDFFRKDGFFDKLAGSDLLRRQLESGLSEEEIRLSWSDGLAAFKRVRSKYLLYPDFE
ncbi:MAG: hypothetical protein ABR95_04090 [Sphingobacteriales bacterium BACL12 MAG-120813-bin55]|mgnify:CR=1 FL=1|jgi:uncharacterized protein YbbC (DUF1343 family)|nr:MAG: hypothetical protein ABR95_04090 [Sphingobacteriales bacterium BACL12 MAG-120813-bin55]